MWKNHFLWRTQARKVFKTLLKMRLKSKKHVKKTFFQLGSRFFRPYNFDPVFDQFLKKKNWNQRNRGFLGIFWSFLSCFCTIFMVRKPPNIWKTRKIPRKADFEFFFHIRSFFIDLTDHFERGISPCSTFQNSPMRSKNSVWGTIRH